MTGTFAVAYFALQQPAVGGLHGLLVEGRRRERSTSCPTSAIGRVAATVFVIPITIQWWSVWYPGAEPGGGIYIAQRMLASQDGEGRGRRHAAVQRHALRAAAVAVDHRRARVDDHLSAALATSRRTSRTSTASLIGNDIAYPAMMRFLPAGFLGLVVAGTLAAYRSTIETHLNWGTSYLVHDFYRRLHPTGTRARSTTCFAGRLTTAGLMICAALMTYALGTAKEAFDLILSIGAGTGLLYLLRWFWWRVSAWSEIAAMVSSFVVALGFFIARKNGVDVRGARVAARSRSRRRRSCGSRRRSSRRRPTTAQRS